MPNNQIAKIFKEIREEHNIICYLEIYHKYSDWLTDEYNFSQEDHDEDVQERQEFLAGLKDKLHNLTLKL